MAHPSHREDLSRFLVHLTRGSAQKNLISILRQKTIEARNAHCLFHYEFKPFSSVLTERFNTVCFTETPLPQIHRLTGTIPGRQIELRGYGLVFSKDAMIAEGACPAVYLNARGTELKRYLLSCFRSDFKGIKSLKQLKKTEKNYYASIIQYYSLINIISENYDFAWEREWRYGGDFKFRYRDLVAIVAEDPASFESRCQESLKPERFKSIERIPIISAKYSYEEVVEAMAAKIRRYALDHDS
jgi:hypothetical protein